MRDQEGKPEAAALDAFSDTLNAAIDEAIISNVHPRAVARLLEFRLHMLGPLIEAAEPGE